MAALSARDEGAEGLRHIVRYYQAWIEDERLYIQTELCDASLESRVRRGRFLPTPPAVWGFLRQMLLALELLHARGRREAKVAQFVAVLACVTRASSEARPARALAPRGARPRQHDFRAGPRP